ncbi:MAG: IPT/TIG domain-containing protein [Gemmatimonadota bacterium]
MRVGTFALVITGGLTCGGGPTDPGGGGPSEPELETVEVTEGDEQVGSVGLPLDSAIDVRAVNDDGSPAEGIELTFDASGDGSVEPSTASTDAEGMAQVAWSLASTPGENELNVTPAGGDSALVVVTATGFADRPAAMALHDGDEQTELPDLDLPAPIRVRLVDEFDNPVVGAPVEFSVANGGAVSPEEAETDLEGVASATWTLGPETGEQTAQALVRDSAVYDIVDLPGSPVSFTATAVTFGLDEVTPEPVDEGDTLTLAGSGFGPDDSDNDIRIDGETASIVETTQTSITVEVPSFGCEAARARPLEITRGTNSATADVTVRPATALELSPGERAVVADPADYCLQFLESTGTDSTEYLVGLTSTREWTASASFSLTAADASTGSAAPALSSAANDPALAGSTWFDAGTTSVDGTSSDGTSSEGALRDWERSFLATSPRLFQTDAAGSPDATSSSLAMDPPAVGDELSFRVPRVVTDPCNDYSTREVTVVHVGTRVVVAVPLVPDLVLSTLLGNTTFQNAVSQLGQLFDDAIYPEVTEYVGDFRSPDDDGLTTIVLSPAWNSTGGPAVFSAASDLVPRETCPASDEELVVYVTTPDLDYSSLSAAVSDLVEVMGDSGPDIAHELTHVAQNVRRIEEDIVQPLPGWLAEGHAEMLVEVVARSLRGDAAGMDYGADVVDADEVATDWYLPRFERLSHHFGWDGASGQVEGAPEQCSLYGFGGSEASCLPEAAPGAAWSFVRYVADRVGSDFEGGEGGLSRELTLTVDSDALSELLESQTGSDLARLVVDWSTALYADGRVGPEQAPDVQVSSWDLADIYGSMAESQALQPTGFGFQPFTLDGSVVGGGTAYLRIAASGEHVSLALKVRDPLDRPLSDDIGARLWVLRLQ